MLKLLLFIYTFLVGILILHKLYILAISSLILIPITISIIKYSRKMKIDKYKKRIEEAIWAYEKNRRTEPFININTEHWSIIELIPGISRIAAKTIANNVKKKKITNFDEFTKLCDLNPEFYNIAKIIIKF